MLLLLALLVFVGASYDCYNLLVSSDDYQRTYELCQDTRFGDRALLVAADQHFSAGEYDRALEQSRMVLDDPFSKQVALEASMLAMEAAFAKGDCGRFSSLHAFYEQSFPRSLHRDRFAGYAQRCEEFSGLRSQLDSLEHPSRSLAVLGDRSLVDPLLADGPFSSVSRVYLNASVSCQGSPCSCGSAESLGARFGLSGVLVVAPDSCRANALSGVSAVASLSDERAGFRLHYLLGILSGLGPEFAVGQPVDRSFVNCQSADPVLGRECVNGLGAARNATFMDYFWGVKQFMRDGSFRVSSVQRAAINTE